MKFSMRLVSVFLLANIAIALGAVAVFKEMKEGFW
jgi:hypothetical protein